jgi:hypothetical protein
MICRKAATALIFCTLLSQPAFGETSVACKQAIQDQWDAFYAIFQAVTKECQSQNTVLEAQGFPNCVSLCSEKTLKELPTPSTEVSVRIGNSTLGSSPYGSMGSATGTMSGTSGTQASNLLQEQSNDNTAQEEATVGSSEKLYITFEVKLKVPLQPTMRVECSNPLNSPIVKDFANAILSSPWIQEKYKKACGT